MLYTIEYEDPDGHRVREVLAERAPIMRDGITYGWTGGGHKVGAGYPPRLDDVGMVWTYVRE